MLQYAPVTAPTHSIKRVGMSRNILQHVEACDANKPIVLVKASLNLSFYVSFYVSSTLDVSQ